ncbi:MAG: ABC transporter ATP-binding protein [Methylotenera sp.]|nr:ABC transporter ATP-binding protein [Oligoflexia bacterium]
MTTQPLAVELRGLAKRFGSVIANAGIQLEVRAGSIHGVIGENGAGKSTAMKMLYGMYAPDEGEILIQGKPLRFKSPSDAIHAGIGMVHQHFMLAGPHTALDNIILGAEPSHLGVLDRAGARTKLQALCKQYGLPLDLDAPVETLSVGVQQRIEILKLLYRNAQILILDEPTAVLTPQETEELLGNLKKLKAEGKTILIITHKLKEVLSFTDEVTVFRGGKVSGRVKTSETNAQQLANLMVGREVVLKVQEVESAAGVKHTFGKCLLRVERLNLKQKGHSHLKDVSFEVRAGEVVGIAGVEGNGQTELIEAILHPSDPRCLTSGKVRVLDQDVTDRKTFEIRALGVGVIPQDRHHQGLLLERSVKENFLLGLHRRRQFAKHGFILQKALDQSVEKALENYDVRPRRADIAVGGLSGGNQQKLIIAREFECGPQVLIAAQPTRGVDVGAIEFIHRRILKARSEGVATLLISSELDEILTLSDRILVIYEGQIVGDHLRGQADENQIGLKMGGGHHE